MKSYEQYCALALALDRVGDRWTLLIVRELLTGPRRFSDLVDGLPGVATNLLATRLRTMEANGLVERHTMPPPSASSVYVLTESGTRLAEPVHALVRWGGRYMRQRTRRQAFRPHWLLVALQALLADAPLPQRTLTLALLLPEGMVTLRITPSGVEPAPADTAPDVRLRGPASLVLGLAAGEIDWSAAEAGGLTTEGLATATAALRRLFRRRSARGRASGAR